MNEVIQLLMTVYNIERDQAIGIYNDICDQFNKTFSHEETIEIANNIIHILLDRL